MDKVQALRQAGLLPCSEARADTLTCYVLAWELAEHYAMVANAAIDAVGVLEKLDRGERVVWA